MTYKTTEKQRAQARRWQAQNPWRFMWLAARNRAARKGHVFDITEQDVQDQWPSDGKCPMLGIDICLPGTNHGTTEQGPRENSASLDRVDNSKGYVRGNIAILSWRANRFKGQASMDEMRRLADWLAFRQLL